MALDAGLVLRLEKDRLLSRSPGLRDSGRKHECSDSQDQARKAHGSWPFRPSTDAQQQCQQQVLSLPCRAVDEAQAEQQGSLHASLRGGERGGQCPVSHPACLQWSFPE